MYTINIKDAVVFDNLFYVAWHPTLIELFEWCIVVLEPSPVITSAYRVGDKGVHGTDPLRGIDIRGAGLEAQRKVDIINHHWQYDPKRPGKMIAIRHNVGRGEHIHLQVHPKTKLINGGWGKYEAQRVPN